MNSTINDPLKVGFFDLSKGSMVQVEFWPDSVELARITAGQLTALYQSGRHRLPSPIWCLWNKNEVASVFLLDEKPRDEEFLNRVLTLLV